MQKITKRGNVAMTVVGVTHTRTCIKIRRRLHICAWNINTVPDLL